MYADYLSECCDAPPIGEPDYSTIEYGGPIGFCSHCQDDCGFYVEEIAGDHFDTQEEKRGER